MLNEFWMTEATFNELFVLVQPHMQDYWVNHEGLRSYSKRHRSLLILSFLAHVPTMRCPWRMYQQLTSRQVDCNCQKTATDKQKPKCIGTTFIHLITYANNALSIPYSWYMYHIATRRLLLPKKLD